MARYTSCTTVALVWDGVGGVNLALGVIGGIGIIAAGVWIALQAFGTAALTPGSLMLAATALIMACLFVINLLNQLRTFVFERKLICLGEDRCAIAHVITIEDNDDGDKSLNTVLAPATADTLEPDYQRMFQPAMLVYVDPGLAVRGFRLDPKAERHDRAPSTFGIGELPFFHCEIEGTYFDSYTTALLAYLWTLVAAATAAFVFAALATALGPIAWVLWLAIALPAPLAFLFGFRFFDPDEPETGAAEARPIGEARPSPAGPILIDRVGSSVNLGDFVAILGRPVCDAGHSPSCWDEIHPVKGIAKILEAEYNRVTITHTPDDLYDRYCIALHTFVDAVGSIKLGLTVVDRDGRPLLTCLEHEAIG